MKVLPEYRRILGIDEPDVSQERQDQVEAIIAALGEECTEFDRQLLTLDEVADHTIAATWLRGDRTAVWIQAQFVATLQYQTYFIANLTRDKGQAAVRIRALLGEGKKGSQIAETLRDEGYSINETFRRLQKFGFKVEIAHYGADEISRVTIPSVVVSNEPSARGIQFWKPETADMTLGAPILWTLEAETVQSLNLPVVAVRMLKGNLDITVE